MKPSASTHKMLSPITTGGTAYSSLGQEQRAIKDYDKVIRLDPQYSIAYANRAITYIFLGRDAEAQQDIEQAIEMGADRDSLENLSEKAKRNR